MPLTRAQKEIEVQNMQEKLQRAASVMFAYSTSLSVPEVTEFRQKLQERNVLMRVIKKTLLKIAVKNAGLPELTDTYLEGSISCIFSFEDPLAGAQTVFLFRKQHPQIELLGGIFDGKLLTKQEVSSFATIPGRTQLLTMFAMLLRAPLMQFSGLLSSPLTGFARALNELAKKKQTA